MDESGGSDQFRIGRQQNMPQIGQYLITCYGGLTVPRSIRTRCERALRQGINAAVRAAPATARYVF